MLLGLKPARFPVEFVRKHIDSWFRNFKAISSALFEVGVKVDMFVRIDQVKYINEYTLLGSPLRRLIVDQCSHLRHTSFAGHRPLQDYSKEILSGPSRGNSLASW